MRMIQNFSENIFEDEPNDKSITKRKQVTAKLSEIKSKINRKENLNNWRYMLFL